MAGSDRDAPGLRLRQSGYRQYFLLVSGDNRLSFFEWDDVQPVSNRRHGEPVKGPFVFDHISIGVTDKEALWEIMARLDAAEFPCSDVIDHGCFLSIYSYDPNGIPIEFSCDVPGLDLFWNPVMQDLGHTSGFLTETNPVAGQWPRPDPVEMEDRIIVPGEGKDNFPETMGKAPAKDPVVTAEDGSIRVRDVMTREVRTTRWIIQSAR